MAGLSPTVKKKIRSSIQAYCQGGRANEPKISYSQARPFRFMDRPDIGWHVADCSSWVINCYWNAGHDLKVYIADPSGQKYSGYGSTYTLEPWLRKNGKRVREPNGYLVGDIAMYNGHTTICTKAGSASGSDWTSHGSQSGPKLVKLRYRGDLVGVWRHPALL